MPSVEPGKEEDGYGEDIATVIGKLRYYGLLSCAYDV